MAHATINLDSFLEFAGHDLRNFTHENIWDLITVLSAELSSMRPETVGGIVRMGETRRKLNISWDAVTEHCFEIFDGINRDECKALIAVLSLKAEINNSL